MRYVKVVLLRKEATVNIGCVQQNIYFTTVGSFLRAAWVMLLGQKKWSNLSRES